MTTRAPAPVITRSVAPLPCPGADINPNLGRTVVLCADGRATPVTFYSMRRKPPGNADLQDLLVDLDAAAAGVCAPHRLRVRR